VVVVVFLILIQNYNNILGKLYSGPHFKGEYRQSVELLIKDLNHNASTTSTMPAMIIANSDFYNHYLQRLMNGRVADYLLTDTQQLPVLDAMIKEQKPTLVYFLEIPEVRGNGMISILDIELAKNYSPLCRTRFVYGQVIKFSAVDFKQVDWQQLPSCI